MSAHRRTYRKDEAWQGHERAGGRGSYLYGMLGLLGWTVLSKAACCFFRITSASFCFTTLLATAPAGAESHDWVLGGWTGGLPVHSLPVALSIPLVHDVPGIPQARAKSQAPPQTPPHYFHPHLHSQAEPVKQRETQAGVTPTPVCTCPGG